LPGRWESARGRFTRSCGNTASILANIVEGRSHSSEELYACGTCLENTTTLALDVADALVVEAMALSGVGRYVDGAASTMPAMTRDLMVEDPHDTLRLLRDARRRLE
jgi:hypothetical protein